MIARWSAAAAPPACEICGEPLDAGSVRRRPEGSPVLCGAFECRRTYEQAGRMSPQGRGLFIGVQRGLIHGRREHARAHKKFVEAVLAAEAAHNDRILERFSAREGPHPARATHVLGIPNGLPGVVATSPERVESYRQHLQAQLAEARGLAGADEAIHDNHWVAVQKLPEVDRLLAGNPSIQRICAALCAQCKGGCCASGGNHAYLSALFFRRLLDAQPELSDAELIDRYLSRIPTVGVHEGCIHQAPSGCTLPRELRSDTCNGYFCDPLRDYQQRFQGQAPARVLAVQRSYNHWNRVRRDLPVRVLRVVLVDEDGGKDLDPALAQDHPEVSPSPDPEPV